MAFVNHPNKGTCRHCNHPAESPMSTTCADCRRAVWRVNTLARNQRNIAKGLNAHGNPRRVYAQK